MSRKIDVRPEVVEHLVRLLVRGGADALAVQLEAALRPTLSNDEVPSGVSPTESKWAIQRFRGMTDEERAEAARDEIRPGLRVVQNEED